VSAAPSIEPIAPAEAPRPTLRQHREECRDCRMGFPCDVGTALEREAEALVANARARALRDARIARGEKVTEPDPPYAGFVVRVRR
jgi:hypothetical protein